MSQNPEVELAPEEIRALAEKKKQSALDGLKRMDGFVQAALTGLLANPHWNQPKQESWLRLKGLNLEQLAVASGMEAMNQFELFLRGEKGGDKPEPKQMSLITE